MPAGSGSWWPDRVQVGPPTTEATDVDDVAPGSGEKAGRARFVREPYLADHQRWATSRAAPRAKSADPLRSRVATITGAHDALDTVARSAVNYTSGNPVSRHRMFPSLSLNQAALPMPSMEATSSFHSTPGMSYRSKVTPLALRSRTSWSTSSTCH
jgi:hypothetical protein